MKEQKHYDTAASKVADLEARISEARGKVADHACLLEQVESLKAEVAATGAAAIAAGVALGDSSDWQQARKALAAAQEKLAESEATASAWAARIDSLADDLHDARLAVKEADKTLTEALHDEACKVEAAASAAFLAAGDEFYRMHCELAAAIDVRIKLRNKITGLPAHTGGGYPVELQLVAPEGASFAREQLDAPAATRAEGGCMKTVEGRVKAILAAVEGLLARRAAKYEDGHEPFIGLEPPPNTKAYRKQVAKAKASFSRDSVLQRIAADERRIEEINARLPSR